MRFCLARGSTSPLRTEGLRWSGNLLEISWNNRSWRSCCKCSRSSLADAQVACLGWNSKVMQGPQEPPKATYTEACFIIDISGCLSISCTSWCTHLSLVYRHAYTVVQNFLILAFSFSLERREFKSSEAPIKGDTMHMDISLHLQLRQGILQSKWISMVLKLLKSWYKINLQLVQLVHTNHFRKTGKTIWESNSKAVDTMLL